MALQNKTAAAARGQTPHKHSLWRRMLQHYDLYLFILPALIWYIIFTYGPLYGV